MAYEDRDPTPEELDQMRALVRQAMEDATRCELFGARYVEQALQRSLSFTEVIQ